MTTGADDPFMDSNTCLSETLSSKQIANQLFVWDGRAYQARDWQKMVPLYL